MSDRPTVRDDLALFDAYHSPQLEVEVRLNTNESPVPPPQQWVADVAQAVKEVDWHRYPDRAAVALRAALAQHHGIDVARVFVGNGSNEVLQTLCLAYGGPGRTALTFEPTYALHAHIATLCGTAVATAERDDCFRIDVGQVSDALAQHEPAITFLCSPNNPTGIADDRTVVDALLAQTPGIVVVDEAYGQFSSWSALELVDDEQALVVTRTFSKTWSMAAARLGYAIAPPWLIAELEKVVLPYHLGAVSQIAGRLALDYEEAMADRVAQLVEQRSRLMAALGQLDVDVWPSDANFVLFRPRSRNGDDVWQALVDRSVLVRNCSSWPRLGGCLRVTVGTSDENGRFLDALGEVL